MRSRASGNCSSNVRIRRLRLKFRYANGIENPATAPNGAAQKLLKSMDVRKANTAARPTPTIRTALIDVLTPD